MSNSSPPPNNQNTQTQVALATLTSTLQGVQNSLQRVESLIATYVLKEVYEAEQRALEARIAGLESWRDWAVRIVLGVVIVAVLGLVIVKTGSTPTGVK